MFEVICIREVKSNSAGCAPVVVVGGKYTVVEVVSHPEESDYYILAEDQPDNCYKASLFARMDGPDERERLEAWQEEQAAEYDRQFHDIINEAENAI